MRSWVLLGSIVFVCACSSESGTEPTDVQADSGEATVSGSGGGAGHGPDAAKAGGVGTGGSSVGTGGRTGGGGTTSAGGSSGTGGAFGSGGSVGTGGSPMACGDAGGTMALTPGQWTNISPPGLYRPRGAVPPYGVMDVHSVRCNPSTLYANTDVEGMWKSTDGGATWAAVGNLPSPLSSGVMALDPNDPLHMYYVGGVRGASLGFWISKDGGDTWAQPKGFTDGANNSVGGWTNDVYQVTADPADFNHLLLTFHSGFEWTGDAGVLESKDGGTSFTRHSARSGWGAGHGISFLGSSTTWLLATQGNGYWRTADSGTTWTQVSTHNSMHGACIATYSKAGALYVGANNQILRSTDNGLTFTLVGPSVQDGYYQVIGDGNVLYAQLANTGGNSMGPQSYITSPDADGVTWSAYNSQTFSDGPYRMDFDPVNRIIYSANFNEGVWALRVK